MQELIHGHIPPDTVTRVAQNLAVLTPRVLHRAGGFSSQEAKVSGVSCRKDAQWEGSKNYD